VNLLGARHIAEGPVPEYHQCLNFPPSTQAKWFWLGIIEQFVVASKRHRNVVYLQKEHNKNI
jgi:hypothetical protein